MKTMNQVTMTEPRATAPTPQPRPARTAARVVALALLAGSVLFGATPAARAGAQAEEQLAPSVVAGLSKAIADRPVPADHASQPAVRAWLDDMSRRLALRMPDARERNDFLTTVHYEAQRAGLDPQLVLSVIHHESGFKKYAVSVADARGYMQVMPFWVTPDRIVGPEPVQPAHEPALRLHDSPPLPRPRERRPLPRAGALQRQPGPAAVPERRRRRLDPALALRRAGDPGRCRTRHHADAVTARPLPAARYRGRFAPSPTGPLHFGSLIAAVASCADARAAGGEWLLRIEDVDEPRTRAGAESVILAQLERYGFTWDGPVLRQRERTDHYAAALARLREGGHVYECACTRRELETAPLGVGGERVYPGTCREGIPADRRDRTQRAWRVRVPATATVGFTDRLQGSVAQDLARDVGDFVLRRADGLHAYQLAVVVDDALSGVNAVVRGADLLASTPRQILLQRLLGFATPSYLHVPVALGPSGEKLSKQTGAAPLPTTRCRRSSPRGASSTSRWPGVRRRADSVGRVLVACARNLGAGAAAPGADAAGAAIVRGGRARPRIIAGSLRPAAAAGLDRAEHARSRAAAARAAHPGTPHP